MVITEFAVFHFAEGLMILDEITSDTTLEEIKRMTPAHFSLSPAFRVRPT